MAREKKEGRFLNAKLPLDLINRVDAYSNKTRIPKTAIAELALREYLDRVAPEKTSEKRIKE